MAHIPHLLLEEPWHTDDLSMTDAQLAHLTKVLRLKDGDPVSYTDGRGTIGAGRYEDRVVVRGAESKRDRPSDLVVVAAPVDNRDRARFMVEKLSELGVAELRFLETRLGEGRPPRDDRLRSWAVSGLEQSRGAWLMKVNSTMVTLGGLSEPFLVCDPGGSATRGHARTVVVGPEGGWAPGELPDDSLRLDLGETVLRVETAALVAAARMI
jgi:16S rRNA (uracil1498-N3)-methyltransferase